MHNQHMDFTVKAPVDEAKVYEHRKSRVTFAGACSERPEELKFKLKKGRRI